MYGRYGNPTHVALHRVLASLEGAEAAWSFSSGMAAIHTVLIALLRAGDHVVAERDRADALRSEPADEAAWVARGAARAATAPDDALADFDRAIDRLAPRATQSHRE